MTDLYRWHELNRATLGDVLPEAVVIVPIGAVEQHGPHLPTGTDLITVTAVTEGAAAQAAAGSARPLVLAPTIPFGASDHHLPYGATLSLTVETTTAVLVDLARSIAAAGGTRVVVVNGHGGNRGPCHSAAVAASTRSGLTVGYIDYWEALLGDDPQAAALGTIPGHAGQFETSAMLALRPDLVGEPPRRAEVPTPARLADGVVHSAAAWHAIDGYTDSPADATAAAGRQWLDRCVAGLADRLVDLAAGL